MSRKATAIFVATLLALSAVWAAKQFGEWNKPPAKSDTPHTTLPANEAKRIETGLSSSNPATFGALWVARTPPLPVSGTTFKLVGDSFVSRGEYGRIDVRITQVHKTPESWRLLLRLKANHWLIYSMKKVK